ncbi:MAG: hypothetical protein ACRC92_26590 [Peptostreptococcaceae bacterium]
MWQRDSALRAIRDNTVRFGDRWQLTPHLTESDRRLVAELYSIDYFPCAIPKHTSEEFKELLSGMDLVFFNNGLRDDKKAITLVLFVQNGLNDSDIMKHVYDEKVIKYLFEYVMSTPCLLFNDYLSAVTEIFRQCIYFGKYNGLSDTYIDTCKMAFDTIEATRIVGELGGHYL